jgi:hypothetical protein
MAVTVLLCYAQEDVGMVKKLKNHLRVLERKGLIEIWDKGNISAGEEWQKEIDKHLEEAQMILLLISASFTASDFCYKVELRGAIKRHEHQEARVIPVILRPVSWTEVSSLDKLLPLPDEAKPITAWKIRDAGYNNVAEGISKVIGLWNAHSLPGPVGERKVLIANLDRLIETVKLQMQPPGRASATAGMLQQLSVNIPADVTLADLVVGWRTVAQASQASKEAEEIATSRRRITCGELSEMASRFAIGEGSLEQAIRTWDKWAEAFKNSDDPREATMAGTFARELKELQAGRN